MVASLFARKVTKDGIRLSVSIPLPTFTKKNMAESRIKITRMIFTNDSTIGELYFDDKFECYTLEDTCRARGVKVYGETAIYPGTYEIILRESPRFGSRFGFERLPALCDVPDFEGVLIHPLNVAGESLGCIGVGQGKEPDRITGSRAAFNLLMPKIQEAIAKDRLWVTIYGGR